MKDSVVFFFLCDKIIVDNFILLRIDGRKRC